MVFYNFMHNLEVLRRFVSTLKRIVVNYTAMIRLLLIVLIVEFRIVIGICYNISTIIKITFIFLQRKRGLRR